MKALADILRESIVDRHAKMQELPYVKALIKGDLPLDSYVAHLRAMAIIHGAIEEALRHFPLNSVRDTFLARPSRLAHLRSDIGFFERLHIPDCIAAVEKALYIAANIRTMSLKEPITLMGFLYVLEGTTLGNKVHLQDVLNALGDKVIGATRYYNGYDDKTILYWHEFKKLLNTLSLKKTEVEGIISTAYRLFDMLETLFVALYPPNNLAWGFTATTLNPEAGKHPVPQDPREIQAAIEAAKRCYEQYPYFQARYKERGESFAKSDAAWLATLTDLSYGEFMMQVEWLSRVLGNRGMPRITLESQLQLLYDALSAAVPERQEFYKKLMEAATLLRSERLSYMTDRHFKGLAKQFHEATDGELQGRMHRTGELILSAICDERAGITDALNSLIPWLVDQERFPNYWISEVKRTIILGKEKLLR